MKLNAFSLSVGLALIALSASAENPTSPSLIYKGVLLVPNADLGQESATTGEITFTNVHFESPDQFFPAANDPETAKVMCGLLKVGSTLVRYTPVSGQISPADVLAYSKNELVTAADKLKLDSTNPGTSVIDVLECVATPITAPVTPN